MDFNDTPQEAAFRKEVRAWLDANATRKSDDKQSFRARNDDPELLKRAGPRELFHRQVYATFINEPVFLSELHRYGPDNIMWSSDYPHSETTWPDSRKIIDEQMRHCTEAEKQRIVHGNAAQLYKL